MIKTFELIGKTFRVIDDNKYLTDKKLLGEFRGDKCVIAMRSEAFKRNPGQIYVHTFYHELVHALMYSMGEGKLGRNEKFVDILSGLIQQFVKTKR